MLVVLSILSLLYLGGNCDRLSHFQHPDPKPKLAACVGVIMKKYFVEAKKLSYFNFNYKDDELLDDIHMLKIMSVSIWIPTTNVQRTNRAYMIVARNEEEFIDRVTFLSRDNEWNPYVRFLVVIDTLYEIKLKKVFNILLQLHIYNVIVVNGTETTELYTYNPFENYACGKYYANITEFGKCAHVGLADLYPDKIITGLRHCFFNVSCPHWPPYSIDPTQSEDTPYVMGTEQYIFHLMSEIEHFKYNFTYNFDAEMFSTVSQDMSVSGPMTMLQANHTDVMLGGLLLTQSRARMFFYVYGHLDQIDEIRIMVKRASTTPAWKDFYHEFSPLVWLLLLLVLMFYAILVIMLLRAQDKGHVVLVLFEHLLQHGAKFHARQMVNIVFICWVWFAYLINCFYQSSLVSLMTKPSLEYQIQDEQDLNDHGLKACISQVMRKYMQGESNIAINYHNDTEDKSCERLINSIRTVSQSKDRFTITIYTVYLYYKLRLYDDYGNSPVYSFRNPYTKVIYAMYFYKGFPMGERLHELALRIRETGLSDKSLADQYFLRAMKYNFKSRGLRTRFAIPWYVYIIGVCISSLTFMVEVASMEHKHRNLNADLVQVDTST